MKDQELVNALRAHAEWMQDSELYLTYPVPYWCIRQAADRIANQNTHILALQKEIEGLREYLDTGLTPEEIDMDHEAAEQLRQLCQNCDLDRLEELVKANKGGRLIIQPCKVGDTLFRVFAGEILEHKVGNMRYLAIQGRWDIDTTPFCPYVESSIGKTIFLTHEEAKAALEAMKDE